MTLGEDLATLAATALRLAELTAELQAVNHRAEVLLAAADAMPSGEWRAERVRLYLQSRILVAAIDNQVEAGAAGRARCLATIAAASGTREV